MKRSSGALVATCIAIAACRLDEPADGLVVRNDSVGIAIVRNTGNDQRLTWTLKEVWAIGGAADQQLQLARLEPEHIATDANGNVMLLNVLDHEVVVIRADGVVSHRFGRAGRGPGELSDPTALDVSPHNAVVVYDAGKASVVRWTAEGKFLDEEQIKGSVLGRQFHAVEDGYVYLTYETQNRQALLRSTRQTVSALDTFAAAAMTPGSGKYPSCPGYGPSAPPLGAQWYTFDADDRRIAAVSTPAYRIDIIEGDDHVRSIRRDIKPIELNDRLAVEEYSQIMGLRHGEHVSIPTLGCTIPPEEFLRARGRADVMSLVADVALGPDGELWALRNGVGSAPDLIDVFDRNGKYLGTLPEGTPFPDAFFGTQGVVSADTDSSDVPIVTMYAVQRR